MHNVPLMGLLPNDKCQPWLHSVHMSQAQNLFYI